MAATGSRVCESQRAFLVYRQNKIELWVLARQEHLHVLEVGGENQFHGPRGLFKIARGRLIRRPLGNLFVKETRFDAAQ